MAKLPEGPGDFAFTAGNGYLAPEGQKDRAFHTF
jgi:hypothetical protein